VRTLLLGAMPVVLLIAVFYLDVYVFRAQWEDKPRDSHGRARADAPSTTSATTRRKKAASR
jgi:hypothetical protein